MQLELTRSSLSSRYDVRAFQSGASMLESLASEGPPDMLVLDWHMPELSGEDLCRFIRKTYDIAQLPILILTATATADGVLQALAVGANDFVRKPFSGPELQARVATLVGMNLLNKRLSQVQKGLQIEAEFRERFMGMLAHDLRQPLNTIVLASQSLSQSGLSSDVFADFVRMQRRAADRMRRMITELLDFTRSRPQNAMPIQRQQIDFAEVVRTSVTEIRLAHVDRSFEVRCDGACLGDWDPDRLAQLCSNLIGNALEHGTRASAIVIELSWDDRDARLMIANLGPDIPKSILSTLFQPFRSGRASSRSRDGVGLGLHIVDQIVRAHHGSMKVSSAEGKTEFVLTLPRQALASS